MNQRKKRILNVGLGGILVIALACFVLAVRFFEAQWITAPCLYNAGVDVLGSLICAVLFFGCMSQIEGRTLDLISLIVLTSFSFLNNEVCWFITGLPAYRTWYLVLCSLAKCMDLGLTYFFYLYVRKSLGFRGRLARWLDHASKVLLIPSGALILLNLFIPICFTVDAQGVFQMGTLFRLIDLYLVIIAPLTAFLIHRSGAPRRQRLVAQSFIVIPILHYLITGGAFGYATQYGSVLISLTLIYCVMFNDRSKKLASTQTELQTATLIQGSMLPHVFPPFPERSEFELYAVMDPAREVGGDFYDFFMIDDDHLCLVIADVSGKGVPAALFMMICKVILQNCAMLGQSAAETLRRTNEAICSNNQAEMFITVWLGILEISTGKMTAANAGHEYPVLKRAGGHFELYKDRHGFVIGGMEGVRYREYEIMFRPGDKLFVYTDGVPEATNASNELFGTRRMLDALNLDFDAGPERLLKNVRRAVDGFVKDAEQFDDLTMLCIEYKGCEKAEEPENRREDP